MDLQKDQSVETSLTQSPSGCTEFIAWGNFTIFDEYDYEIYISQLRNSNRALRRREKRGNPQHFGSNFADDDLANYVHY